MTLVVRTSRLAVHLDPDSGRLVAVRNLARDLDLIAAAPDNPPFRVEFTDSGWLEGFARFTHEPIEQGIRLTWETDCGITLTSDITSRGDDILFTIDAVNHGRVTIDRIEYPIIANIGRLAGPGQDELVHSHATGMLFHDPLDLFEPDPANRRRLRRSIYPEGFAGSTMQMLAYYARARGGFYIGTEDTGTDMKSYNFFKEGELLASSVVHKSPILQHGSNFRPPYPVVLSALTQGTWYEAADYYKAWALQQSWAQPRPRSKWLMEQVGICTFGVNAQAVRSAWLDLFHRIAGTPVFHILGPNWPQGLQDYRNQFPRGKAEWFPARFSAANLEVIRRNGDFWAPFEFDLLCDHSLDPSEPVIQSRVVPKQSELSPNTHWFPYMCAGTDYWHDLHVWRDEKVVADYGCDANYYDISVSNLPMQCLAENHRHRPGSGTPVVSAFAQMYRDTTAAASRAKGQPVPAGTEVISECFMQEFDYYQARAEATPLGPFEVDCFRDWIVQGRAEKIPLFTYVYHEHGPLRLDGWGKLAREAGDLFYWTAARIVLNGGLFQLNYEFSGLEDLDGLRDDPAEHYFAFTPRPYQVDPEKAAFVSAAARMRVGPANPFLAYGTMLPPPAVEAPVVDLDYFYYSGPPGPFHEERGTMTVPSVLATAWKHGDRTAWCIANLLPEEQTARIDGKAVHLPARQFVVTEV